MAAQQGIITVNGYVGGAPKRVGQTETPISVFNMGTTRSYHDQKTGNWVDLPTTWLKVKAYRALALNVLSSIHKGEPVIVTGQLGTETWTDQNGRQQSNVVINATNIGHDLNTGSTTFTRVVYQKDGMAAQGQGASGQAQTAQVSPADGLAGGAQNGGRPGQPGQIGQGGQQLMQQAVGVDPYAQTNAQMNVSPAGQPPLQSQSERFMTTQSFGQPSPDPDMNRQETASVASASSEQPMQGAQQTNYQTGGQTDLSVVNPPQAPVEGGAQPPADHHDVDDFTVTNGDDSEVPF